MISVGSGSERFGMLLRISYTIHLRDAYGCSMFFADSKDCLGIQMVDLCNYFVRRHLAGEPEPKDFYSMFSRQVICAKPEPEWSLYGKLFREHR
jgi:hypothetical protein